MIVSDVDLEPMLIPHHKGRKRMHLGMAVCFSLSLWNNIMVRAVCLVGLMIIPVCLCLCLRTKGQLDSYEHGFKEQCFGIITDCMAVICQTTSCCAAPGGGRRIYNREKPSRSAG